MSKKTGFASIVESPSGVQKMPLSYTDQSYDGRTGFSIGTDYGVGKNQPVGQMTASTESGVPMGRIDTMKTRDG